MAAETQVPERTHRVFSMFMHNMRGTCMVFNLLPGNMLALSHNGRAAVPVPNAKHKQRLSAVLICAIISLMMCKRRN